MAPFAPAFNAAALGLLSATEAWGRLLRAPSSQAAPFRQTLHNFQNVQYFADFEIGGQPIAGIFDTGSFEVLVRSTRCDGCAHPTPPYNHDDSLTYKQNGTVSKHVFGSGPCISLMGYESIKVGPLVAQHQAFWEIVRHRIPVLDTAKFAAIVGIGPNFAYGNSEKTLLMSYGVDAFSVCLGKESGSEGYLTWGPPKDALTAGQFATAEVIGKHHWVTRLSSVKFATSSSNSAQTPCADETGCAVIIDSGTSLIAAPGLALMQLSEQIPEIDENCTNLHELPDLHFVIDGHAFTLPPEAYVMRVTTKTVEVDDIWDILFFKPKEKKVDMCMPAFMQIDMTSQFGPVWIFGMPFFRFYHTTFDRTSKTMQFATASADCGREPLTLETNSSQKSLISTAAGTQPRWPMDMDIASMVPPRLSGMMDYPFGSNGELSL